MLELLFVMALTIVGVALAVLGVGMAGKEESKSSSMVGRAMEKANNSDLLKTAAKVYLLYGTAKNTWNDINNIGKGFKEIDENGAFYNLLKQKDSQSGGASNDPYTTHDWSYDGKRSILDNFSNYSSQKIYNETVKGTFQKGHKLVVEEMLKELGSSEDDFTVNYVKGSESKVAVSGSDIVVTINENQDYVAAAMDEIHERYEGLLIKKGMDSKEAHKQTESKLYADFVLKDFLQSKGLYSDKPKGIYRAYVKASDNYLNNQAKTNPEFVKEIREERKKALAEISKYVLA